MTYARSLGRHFEMLSVFDSASLGRRRPAFSPAAIDGPLVVALDMDLAPAADDPARRAVEALVTSELFEVWRYSDHGAPPDTRRVTPSRHRPEYTVARGWVEIIQASQREEEAGPRPIVSHAVIGSLKDDHQRVRNVWAHPEIWSPGGSYDSKEEAHTALVRKSLNDFADLLISSRPGFPGDGRRAEATSEGLMASWAAGAAILGRLVRQSESGIPIGPNHRASERLFHTQAADDLLPHFQDAVAITLQQGVSPDHLLAFRGRIIQTLLARDDLALQLSTARDRRSELRQIDAIDRVLIFSLAAFDELAHLTNAAFQLGLSARDTKWQKPETLLAELRTRGPGASGIAALYAPKRRPAAVLEVLGYLRNMVHGPGLIGTDVLIDDEVGLQLADLSAPAPRFTSSKEKALHLTAYRGWGIHLVEDRLFLNSEALADKVAFETYRLLDRTLEALAGGGFSPVGPPQTFENTDDARVEHLRPINAGAMGHGGIAAQLGLLHARRGATVTRTGRLAVGNRLRSSGERN